MRSISRLRAIFAGIALQPFLSFFIKDFDSLKIAMEVYGTIILFAGWLEIPFQNFKKWFVPIASLYLVCVIFSSVGFAFIMYWLMNLVGEFDAALIPSILILSAALSSTDSPAIIPTLNILKFKCPQLKHIAISESALTDVSGSIFTQFLLLALISAPAINNGIFAILGNSFKRTFMMHLHCKSYPALLLPIPMFTFVLGNILAGAGFLAAFTSGLLTDAFGSVLKVFHFYDSLLNHLIKPFLFNILGALVPLGITYQLAPIGIVAALIFIFILRPIVIFVSLAPWWMQNVFKLKDLLLFKSYSRNRNYCGNPACYC